MGRFKSAVALANKKLSLKLAATVLASATLISSLLGLFRDRLLNSMYYDTYKTGLDAYTVAFTVPDFMYFILVSGALSVTFIPVLNQRLASGNKQSAWELSTSLLNFMAILTLIASVLIIIFAEPLVNYVVGSGLDEASRALATSMMRVVAVNPFLFAIATIISSMQQAIGRFAFYAMAPAIYNVGIIIGALFFTSGINIFGWQIFEGGIMGVALGVVLGSILQLIVSSIGLIGMGFDYRFKIYTKNAGFKKVLRLLPARSLDQGLDYIRSIAEINIASHLQAGSVRAYQQSSTLSNVPVNLIGVAISTAAFPKMTERIGQGRPDLFKKELQSILRLILWLALPVSAIAFFGRGYLISFIKNGGDAIMSNLLGILAIAILFRTIYHIAARSFYARQDTKTPLYISLFVVGLNILLAIYLALSVKMGVYGIAWAASIAAFLEVVILFIIMSKQIPGLFDKSFWQSVVKMISATGFMSIVAYFSVLAFPLTIDDKSFFLVFPKFVLITALSLSAYLLFSHLLKIKEAAPIIKKMEQILFPGINKK